MNSCLRNGALALCAFSLVLPTTNAYAQLEEIVVTAQKREESLQDVPISISVVSGEMMADAGIDKIEDLQAYVPNLQMTETGISTQMYVRGIGSGNNQAFEQSVGQYIDGIYYGRQHLILAPFWDLDRIEVLRGPQGTLFGKNTIAGALNITTARPSDEFEGMVSLEGGEHGILDGQFFVTGAISDHINARVSGRYYEEDGYYKNDFRDRDETQREDSGIRLSLQHDVNDNFEYLLKLETSQYDAVGRSLEIIQDDPAIAPFPTAGLTFDQIFALVLGQPDAIGDTDLNFVRSANSREFFNVDLDNATWDAKYLLDNGNSLEFTTGYLSYDIEEACDCDFIAGSVFETFGTEDYEQISQEIRLVSPGGEKFDWLAGVFYQGSDMEYSDNIIIPPTSVLPGLNPALAAISNTSASRDYDADSDLFAIFAQGTWYLNDIFRLTVGARFSSEDKSASRRIYVTDNLTGAELNTPAGATAAAVYNAAFGVQTEQLKLLGSPTGHDLDGDIGEDSFTPSVSFEWDACDSMMVYGSISQGYKAGGFDARANNIGSWEFGEEEATAYEVGFKSTLWDDRLELNAAAYFTEYDNLQIAQFDGILGFNVGNAKETEVKGIEVDGRLYINDYFDLNYSLAYLDHEFTDFQNGNCYNRQTPDGVIGPQGNRLCDYSGLSGQYTPEITASVSLHYEQPLGSTGLILKGMLAYNFTDEQNVHVNLDPQYNIDSYGLFDASFGIEGEKWSLSVLGQNIADEEILTYVGNSPLSGSTFGTNTFYGFVAPPQTLTVRGEYRF